MTDKLTTKQTAKLGNALIQSAQEELNSRRAQVCQTIVTETLEAVEKMAATIKHAQEVREFYKRKLKAIAEGEFEVNTYSGTMTFNDDDLNQRR